MSATAATAEKAPKAEDQPKLAKAKTPNKMFVIDTTAQPDTTAENGQIVSGARTHIMPFNGRSLPCKFEHAKPLELPTEVAVKFLKNDGFILTDKDGNPLEYKRRPRQPEELEAGERIALSPDETIARYDELSNGSLQKRALELPGGEKFAGVNAPRAAMIDFIKAAREAIQKANTSKVPDVVADEFVPDAEEGDDGDGED